MRSSAATIGILILLLATGCNRAKPPRDCITDLDCDDSKSCTIDLCITGICKHQPYPDGLLCDDGDLCTIDDQCRQGGCTGTVKDCGHYSGQCQAGRCDPQTGQCTQEPAADGTSCTDPSICTDDGVCEQGVCAGTPVDCNDGDSCTADSCDEAHGCLHNLNPIPGAEGPPNDPTCTDGIDNDCDGRTDAAEDENCQPCSDDDDCDDGNHCTQDLCLQASCDNVVLADGTECDDGLYCTGFDLCQSGSCQGSPVDCGSLGDGCNLGVCREGASAYTCEAQPLADETPCQDDKNCTINDYCQAGVCLGGGPRDCEDGNLCTWHICDPEGADTCQVDQTHEFPLEGPGGDPNCQNDLDDDCDELTDQDDPDCLSCTGDNDCDDLNPCTSDTCQAGDCHNASTSTAACDDGLACTLDDACVDGRCQGTEKDCSHLVDECHTTYCAEPTGTCIPQQKPNDTPCDDGQNCSVQESCQFGFCLGQPIDCSAFNDKCANGACQEADGQCHPVAVEDGTACDDGLYCTIADDCQDGNCLGVDRNCSDGDPCTAHDCDDAADECTTSEIFQCQDDDGCCPGICDAAEDNDCGCYDISGECYFWELHQVDWGVYDDTYACVGEFVGLALHGTTPHVSYHVRDECGGNLRHAAYNGTEWETDTFGDDNDDLGLWTTVQIDTHGNPHISYWNATTDDVMYTFWDGGSWQTENVHPGAQDGVYNSFVLDSDDNTHLVYYDGTDKMKYAQRLATGGWTVEDIASMQGSVEPYHPSIAIAPDNSKIWVAYMDKIPLGDYLVMLAEKTTGDWTVAPVYSSTHDTGHPALATGTLPDEVHLIYNFRENSSNHGFRYSRFIGLDWQNEEVDDCDADTFNLQVDAFNQPHIAYACGYDYLNYATKNGGVFEVRQVAYADARYVRIALDEVTPHIAYYDWSNYDHLPAGIYYTAWSAIPCTECVPIE